MARGELASANIGLGVSGISSMKRQLSSAAAAFGGFKVAAVAATAAAAGIAGTKGLAKAIGRFQEFDEKMTESQAIMEDLTENTMARMQEAAIEVGATTLASADEAAESFFFLASAGLDAEQSIAALPAVAQFAQAGMFDMATATDLATDAQSALGLKSANTAKNLEGLVRVTDVLVRANQLANATVEQFSEAITNKLGPRLRILGKDIEEGVAGLAALADQGLKGRRAGRGLAIVFRDLGRSAVRSRSAFEELNIEVFDQTGNMRNLADIVEDFEESLGFASDEMKQTKLEMLGLNQRAIGFLNSLIGMSDELREFERETRNAGGAAQDVAQKQLENAKKQWELLKGEVEGVVIALGGVVSEFTDVGNRIKTSRIAVRAVRQAKGIDKIQVAAAILGKTLTPDFFTGWSSSIQDAEERMDSARESLVAMMERAAGASETLNELALEGFPLLERDFGGELRETIPPELQERLEFQRDLRKAREQTAKKLRELRREQSDDIRDLISLRREQLREAVRTGEGVEAATTALADALQKAEDQARDLSDEIANLPEPQLRGNIAQALDVAEQVGILEEYNQLLEVANGEALGVKEKVEETASVYDLMTEKVFDSTEGAKDLGREIERASRGVLDLASAFGIVDDSARRVLSSVVNLATNVSDVVSGISSGASLGSLAGPIGAGLGAIGGILGGILGGGPSEAERAQQKALKNRRKELQRFREDMKITLALLQSNGSELRSIASSLGADMITNLRELLGGFDEATFGLRGFSERMEGAGVSLTDLKETARAFGLDVKEVIRILVTGAGNTQLAQEQIRALQEAIGLLPEAARAAAQSISQLVSNLRKDFQRFGISEPARKLQKLISTLIEVATDPLSQAEIQRIRDQVSTLEAELKELRAGRDEIEQLLAQGGLSDVVKTQLKQELREIEQAIEDRISEIGRLTDRLESEIAQQGGPLFQLLNQLQNFNLQKPAARKSAIAQINEFIDFIRQSGQQLADGVDEAALEDQLIQMIDFIRDIGDAAAGEPGGGAGGGAGTGTGRRGRPDFTQRSVITEVQANELLAIERTQEVRLEQIRDGIVTLIRVNADLPSNIADGMDINAEEAIAQLSAGA